ncbi:MAG TPA: PP2C family serine/threonine-protein phosphatase [Acidimicrobiales bacterium]|nr:PP2C family serine/threonine-protein phosphatase [Acidimicrobiales bacterium]
MTRWRYAAATDIGLVRQTNQDALYADDKLAIIADGMGGHAAGEVAAAMSIDLVRKGFKASPSVEGLVEAIQGANSAVLDDARGNPDHFGMGTTVIAIGLTYDLENMVVPTLVHVGDSRAYQLRDGALRQLSEDHSVAEEWVRMGRLTPEEAAVHPRRHQLTRGVGVEDTIAIDVTSINAVAGDRLLLCSDGLSNELDGDTLARLASAPNGLEMAVESLVSAAKVAGGHDNISVILLEFDEVNVSASPIRRTMSTAPPPVVANTRPNAGRPRRHVTWRVVAAVLILLGVIGGGVAVIHWYAYSTYYLASNGTDIVVYQGQPGGVLWYQPQMVADTSLPITRLRPADQRALNATISEPTLSVALSHAKYLNKAWHLSRTTTTLNTSSTTTTFSTSSTTTTTLHVSSTTTTVKKG